MRKTSKYRFPSRPAALTAGLLLLWPLAACDEKPKQAAAPAPPQVILAEVVQENVPIVMEYSGTVKSVKRVDIVPRVSGYIFERFFTEGTFVKEGDPLFLIDPRPYQETVNNFEANLAREKANLKFWEAEVGRYKRLAKSGAASKEKLDATVAKRDTTLADIDQNNARISNAKLDLSFTKIAAPFAGRIQQERIDVGNLVEKQRDILTTLVQMDPIYVVFNISRREVYRVQLLTRKGWAYPVEKMPVEIVLPDGTPYGTKGNLNFVSFVIDPTTDSLDARGVFANPRSSELGGFDLIPGQYVPVKVTVGEIPDALVIPQVALVETQAGKHVYVVGDDNKVESRKVEIGEDYDQKWVVTKGLKKGERIIVEGLQKVRPGIAVKPKAAGEAPAADS
ncbi:MAG: efflux RND transporter periplasmic adaptor subunit [Rhodospirillales bacterium]|nr:efflux RND transporter periplasmic adaptor subunit [Rhodospirillales bacterium]MDH3911266.1 efflux RND transporter periplasmic adaptor subunit [Rhodospirillales bacterium]MDH3966574.1 efflux RND transporter periplasmic adaptor subunit [Rhodospirillales bacterium]